jgi:hypothetical protein
MKPKITNALLDELLKDYSQPGDLLGPDGLLLASGVIRRTYGGHYAIEPRFLVPGEHAIDIGHALLRFS